MTTAYDPRIEWAREDRIYATQPLLGPMVEGDLCDIRIGRHYCGHEAAREAIDADGSTRILCAEHAAKYFPTSKEF